MPEYFFVLFIFFLGIVVGFLLQFFTSRKNQAAQLADKLEEKLNIILPKLTQTAGEQTALLAKEKLESASQNLKDDFQLKQSQIDKTIQNLHTELQRANDKLEKAERDRIGSFETLKTQITQQAKLTNDMMGTAQNLQKVLSNNQQRGLYGEQVAEDLLKMSGFVKGVDYLVQDAQGSGTRPDFSVLLPNGMKINVDSKFPYANLVKYIEANDDQGRATYMKEFEKDIKSKIKQVTTRDYINPDEQTVDFVILFVPNERIFSFIYDKMQEIWLAGMEQKVVFAGPFSFTAILRMVRQSYDYFTVQKNLRSIIANITLFKEQFQKYTASFDVLDKSIRSVRDRFDELTTTRTRMLDKIVEKIELQDGGETPQDKLLS